MHNSLPGNGGRQVIDVSRLAYVTPANGFLEDAVRQLMLTWHTDRSKKPSMGSFHGNDHIVGLFPWPVYWYGSVRETIDDIIDITEETMGGKSPRGYPGPVVGVGIQFPARVVELKNDEPNLTADELWDHPRMERGYTTCVVLCDGTHLWLTHTTSIPPTFTQPTTYELQSRLERLLNVMS